MRISYDPAKRERTLQERGLDFDDAARVFDGPTLTRPDLREDYGEYQSFGLLRGRMVVVVWTPRGDARHVMSMRKCNAREQRWLRQQFDEGGRDD